MQKIDKVVFGDNQFFGINHMSQEKAQQLAEQFHDLNSIMKVYEHAFDCGINSIMLNSNDKAKEITNYFRENYKNKEIHWYPSLPYPHKYANIVAEKGIFPAINEVLMSNNTATGLLGMIAKGGAALLTQDAVKIMQMLVDIELRAFKDLDIKVVFLQNIITDLLLGLNAQRILTEFANYLKKKYNVIPGFLTMNMPALMTKLKQWDVDEVVICSSINKIGYLMSPGVAEYEELLSTYDRSKYQIMAMSALASGAIRPSEAIEYLGKNQIESVVFGASSYKNIKETTDLITKFMV